MLAVELAKIGGIFLLSAVKLFFAPAAAIAAGMGFWLTVFTTSAGGCAGVLLFYYGGNWVMMKLGVKRIHHPNADLPMRPVPGKVFNRKNRFIILLKQRYGLLGLVLLTPGLLSIPIGTVVAARFYYEDKLTLPLLLISVVLWSMGLTWFSTVFKSQILQF